MRLFFQFPNEVFSRQEIIKYYMGK
ncbi:hypothetical protein [Rickettsia felis]|nr:hypothetical protein [Rickettsia felis]